jgi:hypothetical protein
VHGGGKGDVNGASLEKDVELKVRGIVKSCVEYAGLFAQSVELGFERANGGRIVADYNHDGQGYGNDNDNVSTRSENESSIGVGVGGVCSNSMNTPERRRSSLSGIKRKNDKPHSGSNDEDEESSCNNDEQCTIDEDGNDNDDDNLKNHNAIMTMQVASTDMENQNDVSFLSSNNGVDDSDDQVYMDVDVTSDTAVAVAAHISPTTTDGEFKFDPTAASTSKSRIHSPSLSPNSYKSAISTHNSTNDESKDQQIEDQKFNPEAASVSKSRSRPFSHEKKSSRQRQPFISASLSRSHQLGLLGCQQDGLYLILHADDIHSRPSISSALKDLYKSFAFSSSTNILSPTHDNDNYLSPASINMTVISKIIPLLFKQKDGTIGDIIVWGTFELMEELGPVASQCWKDGDSVACSRFGALMLDKAKILREKGMVVSIKTRVELCREVRALAVLEFLKMLSDCCDPLCNLVSLTLGGHCDDDDKDIKMEGEEVPLVQVKTSAGDSKHLMHMLNSDLKLPRMVSKEWYGLLLKLLAVPNFKAALSNAYVDTYSQVTAEYARGIGILDKSSYTLSVQFLNRVTYVQDLVKKRDLLGCLVRSLLETMQVAKLHDYSVDRENVFNLRLDITHPIFIHRRYMPCISDLKCVLNVPGIARLFSSIPQSKKKDSFFKSKNKYCLDAWIETLALAQMMDTQKWRRHNEGHIENESKRWIGAFNASISLGSVFERLLMWKDEDRRTINIEEHSMTLLNAVELTQYVLINGVASWQSVEMSSMKSSLKVGTSEIDSLLHLPMPSVAVKYGCPTTVNVLPVTQLYDWSFHLPLHRFLATCLREVGRRPNQIGGLDNGIEGLLAALKKSTKDDARLQQLFNGLLEFPTIILSRTAQIRSKLWKRNGQGMLDQVLNYAEPSFCRSLRDADLMLLQFALIGNASLNVKTSQICSCSQFISLLMHRFGVFDFAGFEETPVHHATKSGLGNNKDATEENRTKSGRVENMSQDQTTTENPSLTNDPHHLFSMLDELLQLLIILITELPPPPTYDDSDYLCQAKRRLRREVVHRLVSGPRAHSDLAEVHHVLPLQDNVRCIPFLLFV